MSTVAKIVAAIVAFFANPLGIPMTIILILWAILDIINFILA